MRLCRYILITLLFYFPSLKGAPPENPAKRPLLTQKLESQLRQEVFQFLAIKQQEPERVDRIESTISRLQAEIYSNTSQKELAILQLKKIAAYLERDVENAQQEKFSLLHQIDALKTKIIQYETEGRLFQDDVAILRRYIDLYALRIAFLNHKIRVREKFLAVIRLETTPRQPKKQFWPAFSAFLFTSLLLAGIRQWTTL